MRRALSLVSIGLTMVMLGVPSIGQAADTTPPVIIHVPVTTAHSGEPVVISARIQDESQIFGATLWYRKVGSTTYASIDLTHKNGDVWAATIPAASADLQYWMEAYDEFGNGPARAGSPEHPFVIKVGAVAPSPAPVAAAPVTPTPAAPATAAPAKHAHTSDEEDWAEQDQFPTGKKEAPAAAITAPSAPPVPYYQQWWFGTTIGVVGAGVVATVVYFLIPKPVYRDVFGAKLVPGT